MAAADEDTGLPVSLATAWGFRARPSKGPKPGLSLDRIVAAAVGAAAAEGIGAVSMGRVAKELAVSPMSLYRYVGAKDELYVLMQEAVTPAPPEPMPEGAGWRAGLTRWARAQRAFFHENLWLLRIPVSGPPASPKSVAWMEYGLETLDGTGLDEGTKLGVIMLVSGYVRNEATLMSDLDAAYTARGHAPDEVLRRYQRTLAALTDPERHPAVTRVLESDALDQADEPDADFEFGLGVVLDGVAALIARRG
ncbi:TetR/AcrR family transcriptional regulator C-terminal domain-containing protein [Streptomyces sp. Qhu-G9]|uniref:TetR/AcrR family transcriptional regulator C-terminal domain-containing protein n=1 Tax=Streptomyces sp. Qhu-G9 TaxID=3452799 RepID=UPI0022ABCF63|nr:TetR/AcrR family transcriptional regulator C-terminal domain-containing protein [Streptomyces aurantiacus]WAU82137.1 TetR/AcrR family transcriptional regulator C-terminal domain-containing protein [Streptomyces aurantiacus]